MLPCGSSGVEDMISYCLKHRLRSDEVENPKQEACDVNSLMECMDMLDKVNSKITEQLFKCIEGRKEIMKLLDKLDVIQVEIAVLAKLEEREAQQGESYEEAEIVSQSWLQEQTELLKFQQSIRDGLTYMTTQLIEERVELTHEIDQFGSYIHDLEAHYLNKKIEASKAQLSIVVDDDQLVEQKEEFQPFNYTLFLNIDVEKEYKSENVVNNVALELRQLESHSKYFSISSELMDECIDEEQDPYILKFFSPRRQNDIPHLRTKKCKMRHIIVGSFIFIPPLVERSRKIDVKLGVQFISSKWKEKW
ncbi:hypothetical protein H5410_061624 [Solanum commersonii]|uniref:Uncharacterized protein n=1 Tax=Solanum commersonii TaxID=4109 RepID=A0A9J5W8J7_SOLCO|nr:hypothetical protein H5410_061624 [Solanum commersonii]